MRRPRLAAAPPRRLQADRRAHDAARGAERDPLLRALPRARQGLVLEGAARQGRARSPSTRSASRSTAVRSTRRSPRCTRCGSAATRSARWRSSIVDNPMCPGTGHRICNDCMKACIYQKQEPVNIPQIETGVLTDVLQHAVGRRDLRPAHALEPAERRAARTRCRTTARTCSSSASGPAGYTLAHYLVNEGFGVVGIDGLKIEPLPDGHRRHRRRSRRGRSATGARSTVSSTSACSQASAACPSTASPCAGTRTS